MTQYIPIIVFSIFIAVFLIAFLVTQIRSKDNEEEENTAGETSDYSPQNEENENA